MKELSFDELRLSFVKGKPNVYYLLKKEVYLPDRGRSVFKKYRAEATWMEKGDTEGKDSVTFGLVELPCPIPDPRLGSFAEDFITVTRKELTNDDDIYIYKDTARTIAHPSHIGQRVKPHMVKDLTRRVKEAFRTKRPTFKTLVRRQARNPTRKITLSTFADRKGLDPNFKF